MPTIKGNLLFVSSRAAQVSEIWVRAPRVRTHVEGVVTTGNDRFPVDGGEVTFTAVPGPAVLALISQGRAVDTIPILVGDAATQTLRQVVSAAKIADDATQREIEKLAAQAVALVDSSVSNAKKAQDGASRAETAAGNAKQSETNAEDAARRAIKSATSANQTAVWLSNAEQNAAKSASAAAGSASSAKSDADRAANVANSTSWNGDRLTVNGKTSPSLRGPKGDSGASTMADISDLPEITPLARANAVVQRLTNGHILVLDDPPNSFSAVNKGYVDTAVASEKARTVGMVWMVETESQAQAKESSCQKGDFIQVAQTGNIYQVV
nr:MAG TPA_asm: tail fiber protein [Caudoviricetes sp.]